MSKTLKKLIGYNLDMKKLAIIFAAAYILLMIPIIYIGKYDKPSADDYGYAASTYHAWITTHSADAVLEAVTGRVKNSYDTWQGTFSSIFMMALNPAAFDYRLYKLVPAFIVAMLSLACFAIAKVLLGDICKKEHWYWIIAGSALSILTIEKMHTSPSGIYWYNAAVHYTFMHSIMILMLVSCIKMVQTNRISGRILFAVLSVLFAIASGGSNYATCLMGLVFLGSVSVLLAICYKRKALLCLIPLIPYAVSFYLNVTAPGNAVRQGYYQGMPAFRSILYSFKSAGLYAIEWMDIFTFLLMVILWPVFWNGLKNVAFRFPMPGIVLAYSFCMVAMGFTSSYYSMGTEGLSRLHNVVKITYQMLLIFNEAYFIGWLSKKRMLAVPAFGLAAVVIVMFCTVIFASNKAGTFTTYAAAYYLKTGEAAMFYNEYMERKMILEHSSETDIVLKPYQFRPWLLYIDDITTDSADWRNEMVSYWYGRSSVRLE